MNKTFKKLVSAVLVVCMMLSVAFTLTSCGDDAEPGAYTYKSYTTALGTNWNPHSWETNADDSILSYISSPFVTMEAKDTVNGIYQWAYEMATSITDVTAANKADLVKYVGMTQAQADAITEGYVFEIKLNPDAKWENGVKITADDYIYSMKQLLNPKMRNYRANLYIAGESALAGAQGYYDSGAPIYKAVVPAYGAGDTPDYSYDIEANDVYLNLAAENMTLASYTFSFMLSYYVDADLYNKLDATANAYGYIKLTDENLADVYTIMDQYLMAFGMSIYTNDEQTEVDTLSEELKRATELIARCKEQLHQVEATVKKQLEE